MTLYEPGRALAWTHEAERLDGKPAPRWASSTEFSVRLEPEGEGSRVRLRSAQEPAGLAKGIVLRAVGSRQVGRLMDESLRRLEAVEPRASPAAG